MSWNAVLAVPRMGPDGAGVRLRDVTEAGVEVDAEGAELGLNPTLSWVVPLSAVMSSTNLRASAMISSTRVSTYARTSWGVPMHPPRVWRVSW